MVYPRAVYWLVFCSASIPMTKHFLKAQKGLFMLMISHLILRQLDSLQFVDALENLGAYYDRNQLKPSPTKAQVRVLHIGILRIE